MSKKTVLGAHSPSLHCVCLGSSFPLYSPVCSFQWTVSHAYFSLRVMYMPTQISRLFLTVLLPHNGHSPELFINMHWLITCSAAYCRCHYFSRTHTYAFTVTQAQMHSSCSFRSVNQGPLHIPVTQNWLCQWQGQNTIDAQDQSHHSVCLVSSNAQGILFYTRE